MDYNAIQRQRKMKEALKKQGVHLPSSSPVRLPMDEPITEERAKEVLEAAGVSAEMQNAGEEIRSPDDINLTPDDEREDDDEEAFSDIETSSREGEEENEEEYEESEESSDDMIEESTNSENGEGGAEDVKSVFSPASKLLSKSSDPDSPVITNTVSKSEKTSTAMRKPDTSAIESKKTDSEADLEYGRSGSSTKTAKVKVAQEEKERAVMQVRDVPKNLFLRARSCFPSLITQTDVVSASMAVFLGDASDVPDHVKLAVEDYQKKRQKAFSEKIESSTGAMSERLQNMEKMIHYIFMCSSYTLSERMGFIRSSAHSGVDLDFLDEGASVVRKRLTEQVDAEMERLKDKEGRAKK